MQKLKWLCHWHHFRYQHKLKSKNGLEKLQIIEGLGATFTKVLLKLICYFIPVTDPTFGSAQLLLFGSVQITEPFSAEHRTFFFTINCIF